MKNLTFRFGIRSRRLASGPVLVALMAGAMTGAIAAGVSGAFAADSSPGRLSGMVTDRQGNPLVGAEVVIVGPGITRRVERVLTDAHGRFVASDLIPGRYSLRVAATTLMRNGIEIEAGHNSQLSLMLKTLLPALPAPSGATAIRSGDDWKWILRTAGATRPVLRYRDLPSDQSKTPLDPSQELVAMIPDSAGGDTLGDQVDLGSVLAYWRPLSSGADFLVASSVAGQGASASSLATSFRRKVGDGDPQELTVVVHQLNFPEGLPILAPQGPSDVSNALGLTADYSQSRQISGAVRLTSGFEINYLNAARAAMTVEPREELDVQLSPSSKLRVQYGAATSSGDDGTLAEKVGEMNAFPRVSLSNSAPRLEAVRHSEVAYSRHLTRKTKVEAAAYHDGVSNAVVRGFGPAAAWNEWAAAGDALPNATSNGVNFNAGHYGESGARGAVTQQLGKHLRATAVYATGDALAVAPAAGHPSAASFASIVRARSSQSAAVKLVAELPATKTRVIASYAWIDHGAVTAVDPYGMDDLGISPYAGIQIRQPLPSISFLSGAHIEAVASFRNIAGEGYVRLANGDGEPLILTPTYRSFSGGFSVQF